MNKTAISPKDLARVAHLAKKFAVPKWLRADVYKQVPKGPFTVFRTDKTTKAIDQPNVWGSLLAFMDRTKSPAILPGRKGGIHAFKPKLDELKEYATMREAGTLPAELKQFGPKISVKDVPSVSALAGKEKATLSRLSQAHELDEAHAAKRYGMKTIGIGGHAHPDVLLKEHNRLVTLPPDAGSNLFRFARKLEVPLPIPYEFKGQAKTWKFGEGGRVSRHERKAIANKFLKDWQWQV